LKTWFGLPDNKNFPFLILPKKNILDIISKLLDDYLQPYLHPGEGNPDAELLNLINNLNLKFGMELDSGKLSALSGGELKEKLFDELLAVYDKKEKDIGEELMRHLERMVFLQIFDAKWKDHLYAMDNLREGIGLRAYGQRDPLIEYKREAFGMFGEMVACVEEEAVETIFKLQPAKPQKFRGVFSSLPQELSHPETGKLIRPLAGPQGELPEGASPEEPAAKTFKSNQPKVGRNDPCPCGSGKKYKKCCGT